MKILLVALLEYMHIRLYFLILCIQHLTLNYQVIFFHPPQKFFFCPIFCSDFESTGYTRPRPIPVSKYFDNVTHAQICNHLEVEMNMAAAS